MYLFLHYRVGIGNEDSVTVCGARAGREVGLLHEAIEDCSAALASVPAAAPLAVDALRMRLQVCIHRYIPCVKDTRKAASAESSICMQSVLGHR